MFNRGRRVIRERILTLTAGVVVAGLLAVTANALFNAEPLWVSTTIGRAFWVPDDWLGAWHSTNARILIRKRGMPPAAPDIVQTTDARGRRVTVKPAAEDYRSFALFGPDSMTYGINVNDNETIPSRFAEFVVGRQINVYNYGVSGWGPTSFLALMTDPRFPPGVAEKRGFVVYSFNDNHIDRAAGWPFMFVTSPSYALPRYVAAADGSVHRDGLISLASIPDPKHAHDITKEISWALHGADHRRLAARFIGETYREFQKRFESQGFFVMFLPTSRHVKDMTRLLAPYGIHCLDYRNLLSGRCGNERCLQWDNGHPTASGNRVVAAKLAEDLAKFGLWQ